MKKFYLFAFIILTVLVSCNKDEDENEEPQVTKADLTQLNNGVTTGQFAPYTTGSTFDYKYETFSGTSTSTWTVLEGKEINGKYYVEIQGFLGAADNGYFNCEGGDYSCYLPAGAMTPELNMIYMKENVAEGNQWEHVITMSANGNEVQNKYVFTYEGMIDTKTVEGIEYTEIIHISLDLYTVMMGQEILASTDDYFWAKGIGLIEKSGMSGNIFLLSYNIAK
ncbi:MAG: hypothetical protein KQI35_06700 [Bacteroidetes bacterium]|nr:hypothetical protein [Bacteroidota bacterium]